MSPRKRKKCRFQVETLERRIALSYLLEGGPATPAVVAPKSGGASTARPILRSGSQGEDVRSLQESLGRLGYDLGSHGADGKFGPATERAVEHFQRDAVSGVFGKKFDVGRHGVDGIVGPKTWDALERAAMQPARGQAEALGAAQADAARADPVAPGHFLYHYDFHVELYFPGMRTYIKSQPQHVFQELHRCFNCNFPIGGAPRAFPRNGQYIPLEACFLNMLPCRPAPVKFYTNNSYYIKLVAHPGHFEGEDSEVHFLFYTDRDGYLHLSVTAYVTHPTVSEEIIKNQAFLRWQEFARNLGRNLYFGSSSAP